MKIDKSFRSVVTLVLLAPSASCVRQQVASDAGRSRPSAPVDAAGCLRYPDNVAPPVPDSLAAGGPHAIPRILIAASGRAVLLDDSWRIMVWNPAAGREALLLPGAISSPLVGPGDVLFQRTGQGAVMRLSLSSGVLDSPMSDACSMAGTVSRLRGAGDRPVVGLIPRVAGGGAVIQFGERSSDACTVAYEEKGQRWTVEDAQASRDLLVVTEMASGGVSRAVFHRRDESEDRAVPIDAMNVEMAGDAVVFWSGDAASVQVGSAREPIPTLRPYALFTQLPLNQQCVDVEATAGRFIVFRNDCEGKDAEHRATQRVVFDATERRVLAKLDGISGPVAVTPDGRIITAGPRGICTAEIAAGTERSPSH